MTETWEIGNTTHTIPALDAEATELTALDTISYDPGTAFLELEDAALLNKSIDRKLKLLTDPRT